MTDERDADVPTVGLTGSAAEPQANTAALSPYRVLDLADENGAACTKMLADLGADTVRIERPGGDAMRRSGPFYGGIPFPNESLSWFAWNTSKRSVTLDIETSDGQELFRRLAKTADFLVDTFTPGYLDSLGLGYQTLERMNPRLIVTSITPFGQAGPYKAYKAYDLTAEAMGGLMYMTGDPDRPPLYVWHGLAYYMAGLAGAAGSLFAHYRRQRTGKGQHVDVSVQECITSVLLYPSVYWDINRVITRRLGTAQSRVSRGVESIRERTFPCRDGYVSAFVPGEWFKAVVSWMDSEGAAGDLVDRKWEGRLSMTVDPPLSQAEATHIDQVFAAFLGRHTKAELYREAQARAVGWGPVSSVREMLGNEQLRGRAFFVPVEHSELGPKAPYPGAPYRLSRSPWRISRPPPCAGQHNREVYCGELGLSSEDLVLLKESGVI